jgi:ATP-dependent RNA helicase RhlB
MLEEPEAPVESPRAPRPEFLTATRFDFFILPPEVLKGLADAGFEFCTPIQAEALPVLLSGRDVAGQAHTGTGKTAAFLVTVISRLLGHENRKTGLPQAIIMAPTRELSRQIFEEALVLSRHTDISLLEVVGGIDYKEQAEGLQRGADIVIGTPGRIIDYYKQGILKTKDIKFLVIDEADRLLDLGFEKDMRFILRKLPHYEKRQSMLFSATLSYRVLELTYEFMNLPEFISVVPDKVTVAGIEQSLFHVGSDRKFQLLLGLLQREDFARMLIFVNMKIAVERLTRRLKANGIPAEGITGDLPQQKRFKLMERFKKGQIKILVATDVASRGIHVEDISHVINYDIPQDSENYVHRIGRTARAGKTGKAISLACEEYVFHLEPLEAMLGYKIPVVWAEEDWYQEDRSRPEDRAAFGRRERKNGRRGRERGHERASRRSGPDATPVKPKARRVPGAFFGFGPESEEPPQAAAEAEAEASADAGAGSPAAMAEEIENVDKPKKRRRRRRKKRSTATDPGPASPPSTDAADLSAAELPAEPAA